MRERTIKIGRRGLEDWVRSGNWPCSALRGCSYLQARYAHNGDLIDLRMFGGSRDDLSADELDAIVTHHFPNVHTDPSLVEGRITD